MVWLREGAATRWGNFVEAETLGQRDRGVTWLSAISLDPFSPVAGVSLLLRYGFVPDLLWLHV